MKEILDRAEKYASGKTSAMIDKAIAQAYADGYRNGYTDREKEIPVNLRDNKTTYVDLGLPSGTLWSTTFEKEGDEFVFSPYEKAVLLNIPTIEQWNELVSSCRWDFVTNNSGLYRVDCVGPNGQVVSFCPTGMIAAIQKKKCIESFFWVKNEQVGENRKAVHIYRQKNTTLQGGVYHADVKVAEDTFRGFKLPIRLVRKK